MNQNAKIIEATICLPVKDGRVLFGMKRKRIGVGFWKGYGGRVEPGETSEEGIRREFEEEVGLVAAPHGLADMGFIDFHNVQENGETHLYHVHIFLVSEWTGEPRPCDEIDTPTWFAFDDLPIDQMSQADRIWVPLVLAGRRIRAKAVYAPDGKQLIGDVEIEEMR